MTTFLIVAALWSLAIVVILVWNHGAHRKPTPVERLVRVYTAHGEVWVRPDKVEGRGE